MEAAAASNPERRPVFSAPRADWKQAVMFLLSLAAFGLRFYPAFLFVILFLLWNWRRDRVHFIVQVVMVGGVYSMYDETAIPHLYDLLLLASLVFIFILRKDRLTRQLLVATLLYAVVLLVLMTFSVETMAIQLRGFRNYLLVITFMLPLGVFADEEFDMLRFFQVVGVYVGVICVFYVLDTFLFQGWILVPGGQTPRGKSVFWAPVWQPFTLWFPRKYPPGLYWLALCVYPAVYIWRLSLKQTVVLMFTFFATRTMTVIAGLVLTYLLFQRNVRRTALYMTAALVSFVVLYFVDASTGGHMRISSTVDQFTMLDVAKDNEDLAEFGSNRMAQILPKIDMLYDQGREWVGFGFIDVVLSKNSAVQLTNDLYSDIEKAEENVAAVEVTQIHTLLMTGYIGLIAQTLYYVMVYVLLRRARCRYALFYLSVVVAFSVFGIGGFSGLTQYPSLLLVGLALGVTVLQHRREEGEERVVRSGR